MAAGLTGMLLLLIVLPPVLSAPVRTGLMAAFHAVCHQLPERSFSLGGVPIAVCHRCTGIYAGLFLGALLFPLVVRFDVWLWTQARWLLTLSLVPMAIDWGGDALGLFVNTPLSQAATGLVFGAAAAYLLARGLAGLFATPESDGLQVAAQHKAASSPSMPS